MYKIALFSVLLVVGFQFEFSQSACCFGIRKVCESLLDIEEQGHEDWKSLIITPGRCQANENQTEYIQKEQETITAETFKKTPSLTNIYIVNTLVNIKADSFNPVASNLVYLTIIHNNITEIPPDVISNLPRLKKLVLRENNIQQISPNTFRNLPKLEVLLLSGNELKQVKSNILNTVYFKSIDLSFNKISEIEKNAFPKSLILLNLKKNEITYIEDETFANLNSLEMLILSKNKIKKIRKGTFKGLNNLSKLDLSRNELTDIEPGAFSDLQELMFLYLKHNQLKVLRGDVFALEMINLNDLELEKNNLTFLSNNLFKRMPSLEEISIGGNLWNCKCLENIKQVITNREISLSDSEVFRVDCVKNDETHCEE